MLQNPLIQEQEINKPVFEINEGDFTKFISSYKLTFDEQSKFNKEFGIETDKPASSSTDDLKKFLQDKLNEAFQNPDKLTEYKDAIRAPKTSTDRGIHDGYHVANVALYARNFLKIYQDNKELFSPEIQKEIEEFNDPKKVKDLEILCLLHDVARTNKGLDQDEYKNAFYVALRLREMGDERFQGDEIKEEGLKMIMDLALKESDTENKSLMSKLIQGADSLALLRIKRFNTRELYFDPNLNNVYNDFKNINPKNAHSRSKLINIWNRRMQTDVLSIENKEHIKNPFLEFLENSLEEFLNHPKTIKLQQAFLVYNEINSRDEKNDFAIEQSSGAVFVHVFAPSNQDALEKCNSEKFICMTMLINGSNVKHYAEWSWVNNPFLISDKDDVIFVAGFVTDVGSNVLKTSSRNLYPIFFGGFQSDIDMSNYVAMTLAFRSVGAYHDNIIFHPDAFELKLDEISSRRSGDQTDISDGIYWLTNKSGERKLGKVGAERFGAEYSKPHFFSEALSNELRHNECHMRNSVHVSHRVGISDITFNFLPSINFNSRYSDHPESGLFRLQKYKNQINAEKKRLDALDKPMEDEKFKECVDFELSRVTSLFETIHFLQQMRKEIQDNPDNEYWLKSSQKKAQKHSEFDGFTFEISDVNQQIWNKRKIEKINRNLVELYANLREFEQEENFGFKDLSSELEELTAHGCTPQSFGMKIADWKSKIIDGKTNSEQLQFAIKKVKEGLQKETKMVMHNVYKPQEFKVLTDEAIEERFKEITSNNLQPESLFKLYFNSKKYLEILKIFNKKQLTELTSNLKINFEEKVFEDKSLQYTKQEVEQLIDAGLDIHKFDDKEAEAGCFGLGSRKIIQPYSYETAKKLNNTNAVQSLLEYGVLISDKFNLAGSDVEKNMAKFCNKLKTENAEVLDILKSALETYHSKEDLKKVTTLSFGGKDINLNGYGLLRIFENNLIQNPSREISELFKNVNAFKDSGQANNTESVLVEAQIGFISISQAPAPVTINAINTPDPAAGVGFRTTAQLSPPALSNSMDT